MELTLPGSQPRPLLRATARAVVKIGTGVGLPAGRAPSVTNREGGAGVEEGEAATSVVCGTSNVVWFSVFFMKSVKIWENRVKMDSDGLNFCKYQSCLPGTARPLTSVWAW